MRPQQLPNSYARYAYTDSGISPMQSRAQALTPTLRPAWNMMSMVIPTMSQKTIRQ